jgi:hypothetical protein
MAVHDSKPANIRMGTAFISFGYLLNACQPLQRYRVTRSDSQELPNN